MSDYLGIGSYGVGKKIIDNYNLFNCNLIKIEIYLSNKNKHFYRFEWSFDVDYKGMICIVLDCNSKKISNSSLIETNDNKFTRPLGLYNDSTLYDVFKIIMNQEGIVIQGIFSD